MPLIFFIFMALNHLTAQTRPDHTFSIIARHPATGDLGVAVQSHWFSVGSVVPSAEAGVGAIATQSFVDPSYGRLGFEMMRSGRPAPDALKGLLLADEGREVRQVAMVDAKGRVAAHTGTRNIASPLKDSSIRHPNSPVPPQQQPGRQRAKSLSRNPASWRG